MANNEYASQQTVFLDHRGAPVLDALGNLTLDNTVQSEALVLLFGRRGDHYRDKSRGSRLHQIKTVADAERDFLDICNEALKPLIDTKRILRLEQGALETDPGGFVGAELIIYITEEESIKLRVLPLKARP